MPNGEPLPNEIVRVATKAAAVLFALDAAMENAEPGSDLTGVWRPPHASSSRSSSPIYPSSEEAYALHVSERAMRVPEVARVLGIDGTEVYGLIERGELEARKGPDGLVYVTEQALQAYETVRRRHLDSRDAATAAHSRKLPSRR